MALQFSTLVRNARLDAIETQIGASAVLKIFTGSPPANCGVADSGTLLATFSLPADYWAAASGGSKAKSGTWSDAAADGTGTAGYWRLYATDGTTCGAQGTCSLVAGGGDLELQNTNIVTGQGPITVTAFTLTDANA